MKEKLYSRSHIQELSTGNKYTGIFCCDTNEITVEIYSYDDYIDAMNKNELLLMRTANNEYTSLHDYLVSNSGSHNIFVVANTAIIGRNSWHESYRVKRTGFLIEHAKISLENRIIVERINEHKYETKIDTELF